MPLKYRILIIVGLCLASIYLLFPRDVATRYRGADGVLRVDTSRHVPLRRGLDLQGGMYLALEVDDSKQAIAASDKKEAIDRALKTVRSRIEGFGVSEPVVQKQGDDRIVVQLPGIQDRERAERLMQNQAFLQFKITDKSQALERDLPKLDQIVKSRGLGRKSDTARRGRVWRREGTAGSSDPGRHEQEGRAAAWQDGFGQEGRGRGQGRREEGHDEEGHGELRFAQAAGRRRVLEPAPAGRHARRVLRRQ